MGGDILENAVKRTGFQRIVVGDRDVVRASQMSGVAQM
jgi:hypothetical protein